MKKKKKKAKRRTAASVSSLWMYLEKVVIHTIKASVSLQRPKEESSDVYVGFKPGRIMHDLMMRIENAQFKLDPLVLQNTFVTTSELKGAFMQHYNRALKKHLFSTLGSLQALGNPAGLVRGMVEGASDAVAEPLEGLVRAAETSDISELKRGLQRGASSLAQKTVGGVANSASLITNTISTAGSALALDKEYKLRRAERRSERLARQRYARGGAGSEPMSRPSMVPAIPFGFGDSR